VLAGEGYDDDPVRHSASSAEHVIDSGAFGIRVYAIEGISTRKRYGKGRSEW
jgi:hypothetical protein